MSRRLCQEKLSCALGSLCRMGSSLLLARMEPSSPSMDRTGSATERNAQPPYSVYAAGDFIIAAGDKDTLLQRDVATGAWAALTHPSGADVLNTIWGDGISSIWVAGNHSTLLHYDGKTWTTAPCPYANENIVEIWGLRRTICGPLSGTLAQTIPGCADSSLRWEAVDDAANPRSARPMGAIWTQL